VELTSSKVGTFDVSYPKRTADEADGTSPEELIAAAHSSCYSMALSSEIQKAGGTPQSLETQADVTLSGGRISGIKLTVRAEVDGLDADGFQQAAEAAKVGCPVSQALTGTTITLDAQLDS
jgi:osmotically inducible protein OsmC